MKTTMASMFPNAILLAFEKGYKAQVVNKKDINEWEDLIEFIDELEFYRDEIGDDIQTIVFDTVDEAYPLAEPYMCRMEGRADNKKYNKKQDIAFGQGWALHDKYFREQLTRIYNLGFAVQYITHSTTKTIKPKEGAEYDVQVSTMPDRLANMIYPECDYIIRGERTKIDDGLGNLIEKRMLVLKGTEDTTGGSRVHLDSEIVFDNEREALDKLQSEFKANIMKTLSDSGVTTDYDTLSKQQAEDRAKKVKEYISNKSATNIDEDKNSKLKLEIAKIMKDGTAEQKAKFMEKIKKHNITDLATIETYPTSVLEDLIA